MDIKNLIINAKTNETREEIITLSEEELVNHFELYKRDKLNQLEEYISKVKETGVEYQDKWFKCDDECKTNITQSMIFIDSLLPLTWFTRNGEFGTVTFTTKEEFMAFVQVIAGKLAEIQNSYYQYKYAIEQAQTEEELNAIVFGGGSNDTQEE